MSADELNADYLTDPVPVTVPGSTYELQEDGANNQEIVDGCDQVQSLTTEQIHELKSTGATDII